MPCRGLRGSGRPTVLRPRPAPEDPHRRLLRLDARPRFLRSPRAGRPLHDPRLPAARGKYPSPARGDLQGARARARRGVAARCAPRGRPELERPHRVIAIVDYGVGNLANVERGLQRAGATAVRVTRSEDEILAARAVVLPGVGHFGHCARELRRFGLNATVRIAGERGIPLLGLCVGMQLLFEGSDEDPDTPGLGIYRGRVRRLRGPARVPHTGWNRLRFVRAHPWLTEVPDAAYFYFVHAFAAEPEDQNAVVGTVEHGGGVTAAGGGPNNLGLQFHPEKSGAMGVPVLAGFVGAPAAGAIA